MSPALVQNRPRLLRFLPVVERELRRAARNVATYRWRTVIAATGLAFMGILTSVRSAGNMPVQLQGYSLFQGLVLVSSLFAFLSSISVTADAVSREKREGTLGLLFLTDLRGRDIILGKLAANSLNTIYGLLALLPLLGIPVLMGGVSIRAGVLAALAILNLLFVSLSVGIFVSTVSWDERRSTFAAMVTGLVVMLGPLFLFSSPLASLSPLASIAAALSMPGIAWNFLSLAPSHLVGWLFLLPACRLAQSASLSRKGATVRRTVDERLFTPSHPGARTAHRRRLLEAHPLVWLLERHRGKRFYADILVFSIMAIWVSGYTSYGSDMFGGPGWFLVAPLALTVHLILASWVVSEASTRLIEDRRSGALELLFCTSLTDRELVQGHRLVLRRLFLRPVLLLIGAELFIAFQGFGTDADLESRNGQWMLMAMAAAVALDTESLSWIGLRLAASLPTVNRVGVLALTITPLGPMYLTGAIVVLVTLSRGIQAVHFQSVLLLWIAMVVLVHLVVGRWICRRSVLRHFRKLASQVHHRAAVVN